MTRSFHLLLPVVSLALACTQAKPGGNASAAPLRLDADAELHTASGASLTGTRGWYVTRDGDVMVLQEPGKELSVAIVETRAPDAAGAIEKGWKLVQPKFARKVEETIDIPAREGWDEIVKSDYQTTTQESREVFGYARRKGDLWYVALVDGTRAAGDRRAAQLMTILFSLKPKGMEKESFQGRTALALDGERLRAFEAFVEEARAKAGLPGASVVVVGGGKVVFEKGFGVRELGKGDPVTPETLFMIASVTKPLTTFMMARLVDEGRLSWTTPVTSLLPSFALGDAEATRKLTLAHTVCACTGLPRRDMEIIFEYAGVTPEMRIDDMRSMKPTTGFGETFQYSNSMVSTGGYAAARALDPKGPLGPAYDAAMQSRVFDALGMRSTTLDFSVASKRDHATPHGGDINLAYAPIPLGDEEGVIPSRPAGGVWSNVSDMARYVLTELGNGKTPEGVRVVSEANLLQRREPQVKITDDLSYGLGITVERYHGLRIVQHDGGVLGFSSNMFFLPDHGVGMVVLTNGGGGSAFTRALRRRLIELLFDGREEARQNLEFAMKREREAVARELKKIALAPDAAWLSSLAGTYHDASLGKVEIRIDGKTGIFDAGEWKTTFGRKTEPDGTVKIVLTGASLAGLELTTRTRDGRVALELETEQQRYLFERVR